MSICIYHCNPAPSIVNSCHKKRGDVEGERETENCLWRRHARPSPVSAHLPHAFYFALKESFNGSTWRDSKDSKDGTGSLLWPLTWDMLSPWWGTACGGRDANNNVINAAQKFLPFERDRRTEREREKERRIGGYKRQKARSQLRRMAKVLPDIWVEFSFRGKENAQQWQQNYIETCKNK